MTPPAILRALGLAALVGVVSPVAWSDPAGPGAPPPNRLVNPGLRAGKDGAIEGWTVTVGAGEATGPRSMIEPLEGGGVALAGDAATTTWLALSQRVDVAPETTIRLSFRTRGVGLARARGPFGEPYVGVLSSTRPPADGQVTWTIPVREDAERAHEGVRRVWGGFCVVRIFLPQPGRLEVRDLRLETSAPADSLDVLDREMRRLYAHFDPARPSWAELMKSHRGSFPADGNAAAFVPAARALLAPLDDPHVWLVPAPGAALVVPAPRTATPNGDIPAVRARLSNERVLGRVAILGDVGEDVAYLGLFSLQGDDATFVEIHRALDAWRGRRRALLVDLRWNGGGNELRGRAIASRFADRDRVYARRRVRAGPGPFDFGEPFDARLSPAKDADPTIPVVVLVGPVCMSSGEGTALAFQALPHVRLVGQPTRGASGNPTLIELPNGVDVHASSWVTLRPDGTPLEHRGVPPDVLVPADGHGDGKDPTFEKGLEVLRRLVTPR